MTSNLSWLEMQAQSAMHREQLAASERKKTFLKDQLAICERQVRTLYLEIERRDRLIAELRSKCNG